MLEFLSITSSLFDEVVHLPAPALKGMARLRGKLKSLFAGSKKTPSQVSKNAKLGAPSFVD